MKLPQQLHRHLAACALLGIFAACQTTHTSRPNRFDRADTNHDGRLDRNEISDMLVTEIFNGCDANKDGKLTKEEWLVPGAESGIKSFAGADTNHDGVVTLKEAKAYGRKIGVGGKFLKEADKNRDGHVDRAEAEAYYASKEGPRR
jgi:Ca2+-binding EF-hand superfamily protein